MGGSAKIPGGQFDPPPPSITKQGLDWTLGAVAYPSMLLAMLVRRHTKVFSYGEGWSGGTQVGESPERRSFVVVVGVVGYSTTARVPQPTSQLSVSVSVYHCIS